MSLKYHKCYYKAICHICLCSHILLCISIIFLKEIIFPSYFSFLLTSVSPSPTFINSSSALLLISPALKTILSFFYLNFCLLFSSLSSHPISLRLSISVSLSPPLKRYHLFSRMSWICCNAITMGTVTEEIMSESNRKTDG